MSFNDIRVNANGTVAVVLSSMIRNSESGYSIFDLQSRPVKMVGFVPVDGFPKLIEVAISANGKFLIHSNEDKDQLFVW